MGGVRQVSLDPLRTKRVFECLYYHGKDLCVGCREMLCSTLSHRSEVTETCPGRENQQILFSRQAPGTRPCTGTVGVERGPRWPQRGRTTSKVKRVWVVNGTAC